MKKQPTVYLSSFQYEDKINQGGVNWTKKFKQVMRDIVLVRSMSSGKFNSLDENSDQRSKLIIRNQCIVDAEATIVLLGPDTWKSKKVDFEIAASIERCQQHGRCGLIGIFLPDHPDYGMERYDPYTVPPRLYENVRKRYAKLYDWTEDLLLIKEWLLEANIIKGEKIPSNHYPPYEKDLAIDQTYWQHH